MTRPPDEGKRWERRVGTVFETITVSNGEDRIRAAHGQMERSLARSIELDEILIDSGNTTICLPADMIARLGLDSSRTVAVETGFGIVQARMFPDLELEVCGRSGTFACVELPIGSRPTLGGVPMAALGLDADLANHRLRVLPENGPGTYWRA